MSLLALAVPLYKKRSSDTGSEIVPLNSPEMMLKVLFDEEMWGSITQFLHLSELLRNTSLISKFHLQFIVDGSKMSRLKEMLGRDYPAFTAIHEKTPFAFRLRAHHLQLHYPFNLFHLNTLLMRTWDIRPHYNSLAYLLHTIVSMDNIHKSVCDQSYLFQDLMVYHKYVKCQFQMKHSTLQKERQGIFTEDCQEYQELKLLQKQISVCNCLLSNPYYNIGGMPLRPKLKLAGDSEGSSNVSDVSTGSAVSVGSEEMGVRSEEDKNRRKAKLIRTQRRKLLRRCEELQRVLVSKDRTILETMALLKYRHSLIVQSLV